MSASLVRQRLNLNRGVKMQIEFLRPDRPISREQVHTERYDKWEEIAVPYPASQATPDWFKVLSGSTSEGLGTVKRCPPFLDAMTAGYLIPFPDEAEVRLSAKHKWEKRGPGEIFLGTHFVEQYSGSWFQDFTILKFDSPWIIRTPEGYSTLFVQPLNRPNYPFCTLSGIVETDTYYNSVSFPLLLLDNDIGKVHILPKGLPLVQAIPFRREDWQQQVGTSDDALWTATREQLRSRPFNVYKDQWHRRKSFE